MTQFIKVLKKEANKAREYLMLNNLYLKGIKTLNDKDYVYFPIIPKANIKKYPIVNKNSKKYSTTKSFRDILVNDFKIKDYYASYDTVGNIAIIKITDEMEKRKRNC